ncbi:MAG: aldehyde ferredoxin oxidoreductase [Anaerolineales bacterium]|nr:aldehyde ferredoxin oxidoreductase [Chloroflexota bacterium]MBL6983412.1 aldehyde ferredoxin oxidoreductase [Anaerolineales bacterium]
MKILYIDLQTEMSEEKKLADPLVGGRLLTSQLVTELVDPQTDPLGVGNALVFAAGPLSGKRISTGGRLSIGGKSPLTGGIKEANAGGMAGDSLAVLGYRALAIIGNTERANPVVLVLDENGVRIEAGKKYWGLDNETLAASLHQNFGDNYVVISIGTGGEQQLKAAGIAVTDEQGKPFRLAARGGLGAVMGAKGIKAILIQRANLNDHHVEDPSARKSSIEFNRFVAANERVKVLREYGTASTVMPVQILAGLPVRNFSQGRLENAESLSGETMRDLIEARGGMGTPSEACMAGCVIQCSNIFPDEDGKLAAAPVEFETIGLCGANIGINTLDDVARINHLCNDIGLDTIEIGAALGVMMEAAEKGTAPPPYDQADLPHFGDAERAIELVAEIGEGTSLGKLLGDGVVATGHALGVTRIPAVKGQALSAYDPRVVKGTGVTYATSPQGADHTAGLTLFAPVKHEDPETAIQVSRSAQLQRAAYDALGLCVFNLGATALRTDIIQNMLEAHYEIELQDGWLNDLGKRVIDTELAFNHAAGFTKDDDRLPAYFETEKLQPKGFVFDIPHDALDAIWDED